MITVLIRKYHNADDVHSSPEKGHVGHPWSVWVGSLLRLSLCKKGHYQTNSTQRSRDNNYFKEGRQAPR